MARKTAFDRLLDRYIGWSIDLIFDMFSSPGKQQRRRSPPRARRPPITQAEISLVRSEAERVVRDTPPEERRRDTSGFVRGRLYTAWRNTITELRSDGRVDEAEELLLKCIAAAESYHSAAGVPPWYYHQLAILYRKEGRIDDEIRILRRYVGRFGNARSKADEKLVSRLVKLELS